MHGHDDRFPDITSKLAEILCVEDAEPCPLSILEKVRASRAVNTGVLQHALDGRKICRSGAHTPECLDFGLREEQDTRAIEVPHAGFTRFGLVKHNAVTPLEVGGQVCDFSHVDRMLHGILHSYQSESAVYIGWSYTGRSFVGATLRGYWELLARYLRAQLGAVAVLGALVVGNVGLQLLSPQILRYFVDAATGGGVRGVGESGIEVLQTLTAAAGLYFGAAMAQQLVAIGVAYAGERVAWRATNALRGDLTLHCLRLDPQFHQDHPPGQMIERIDGDVNALSNFFSQFLLLLVANALFLAGMLVLIARESWAIGLTLTLFTGTMFALMSRPQTRVVPYLKAMSQAAAELFGFLEERLAGIEDLQSRGAGAYALRLYHRHARARFERTLAYMTSPPNVVLSFVQAVFVGGNVIALGMSGTLFASGALSLGTVFMIYQYANTLGQPIRVLADQLQDFQKATAGIQRLVELTRLRSGVWEGARQSVFVGESAEERLVVPQGPLGVEFEGVTFTYPRGAPPPKGFSGASPQVLSDVSFSIDAGRVLGVLGRTGSGKTTIGRLLARLYDPREGVVRLGGVNLREADLRDVRRKVGVVTQEVQLLNAPVRDNLTLFDDSVPDGRLLEVVERLGLDDWYRRLPRGLDTRLAAGGGDLSAGEAQLLAFARVFLRDPGLVLLDEASSRLDPVSEVRVERAVGELLRGRTAVVIAHRLATVERVDDVLIISDGRVEEHGTRASLTADGGSRLSTLLRTGMEGVLA